jgi:hypothetical protein
LPFGRTIFTASIFFGGTALDEVARLGAVFALFAIGFVDTSAFHFSLAACCKCIGQPHLLKNAI